MRTTALTTLRTCLAVLVLTAFIVPTAPAQAAVGAFGGVDMTNLSGDAPAKTKYRSETGFAAGAVGEFRIAKDVWLSLQPTWLQRGTKIAFAVEGEEEAVDSLKVAANYLTLASATDSEDIGDTFRPIDLSAVFAFGVMLPVGRPRLTIELRYSQSIINTASSDQDPEVYSLPPRFRWSGLQLFAGFLYPFGGGGS
jgi:hypothetical protein